ncbi:MAG: hypothetical protein M3Q30_20320 [Actinomycetota bacterium]|nr:hypothetical protein [Actinomycetota bacterium]
MRAHAGRGVFLTVGLIVGGLLPATHVLAVNASGSAASPTLLASYGAQVAGGAGAVAKVDASLASQAVPVAGGIRSGEPRHVGVSQQEWARLKSQAVQGGSFVPTATPVGASPSGEALSGPQTPSASVSFQGMKNSTTICAPSGCEPSDMGLAASGSWVVQTVNTSIAVYNTSGALQAGFPKDLRPFFGVPNPSPSGCAHGAGAFLADPRAFFDQNDQRFWVMAQEDEGVTGSGINPDCNARTGHWVAVSQTSDPRGAWFVEFFNYTTTFPGGWVDYPGFGYDSQAVYLSGNVFPLSDPNVPLRSNFVFAINKKTLESGTSVGFNGFTALKVGTTLVDTIQPVKTLASTTGPQGEFLVNSFNINFGGTQCQNGCSGLVVWAFSNPLKLQGNGQHLTGVVKASNGYSLAPSAPNPGGGTVETLDTRITGQPTFQNDRIWASLDTNVNNGTRNTAGIYAFEIQPRLTDSTISGCSLCTTINSSTALTQQFNYVFGGSGAAWFGTFAPDNDGNQVLVFNFSSNSLNPSSAYATRRITQPPNAMHDLGRFLFSSTVTYTGQRWGDYSAAASVGNNVWIAAEHSCVSSATRNWCTGIGKVGYLGVGSS